MSRYPCSSDDDVLSGQCCRKQKCANYSGAHAVSRGCVLYGTLEAELAVHIPGGAEQALVSIHAGVACVLCGICAMCLLIRTRAALLNNPGNPAMFDWGTYVNGGRPDPSWRVAGVARKAQLEAKHSQCLTMPCGLWLHAGTRSTRSLRLARTARRVRAYASVCCVPESMHPGNTLELAHRHGGVSHDLLQPGRTQDGACA